MKHRIYEIQEDELKNVYGIYKSHNNGIIELNNEKEEEGWKGEEFPFYNGRKNRNLLENYIKKIAEIVESNFKKTYLKKSQRNISYSIDVNPFKKCNLNVFISHSHKDLIMIEKLAEWIYKRHNKMSFIDSKFWPYFNDVIEVCIQKLYCNNQRDKYNLWDTSKFVRDIIDTYLLESLQMQLLHSNIIIIVKTENYSYDSPWIRFENNVIDYICKIEKCEIKKIRVIDLLKGEYFN